MRNASILGLLLWWFSICTLDAATPPHVLTVQGTRFLMDGKPFPFTGISFFNAIYNPTFNQSSAERRRWLGKFQRYGINVIRIWCQWDGRPQYADAGPASTMYGSPDVPPSGIPDPEFNPYHRQVLEFIALRGRYAPELSARPSP
jgi:hypothetical protein